MAKGKRNNTLIISLVTVVILLVVLVIIQNGKGSKGERVTTEEVMARTIKETVSASGKIFPQTEVKISSDVSGEVVKLYIEEGDSVSAGQLLANVDPEAIESQVERGRASVNTAKAQLANSRSTVKNLIAQQEQIMAQLANAKDIFERNKKLFDQGVISEADFQQSETNYLGLEANLRSSKASVEASQENVRASEFGVKSAEATLDELRTSLRRTSIYAPMNGIISMLSIEEGERVVGTIQMTGTEMMRIANLDAMEVRVDVSENDIPRVSIGDEVDIEVDAYIDRVFKGQITQIANSASNSATASLTSDQVTNFEVRINISPDSYQDLITPEKPFPFRPGMSASVEINTDVREKVATIPIQSVTTREKSVVFEGQKDLEDPDELVEIVFQMVNDTIAMMPVETGIQDDSYIEVTKGIEVGQIIVTGPYSLISRILKSGDVVEPVKQEDLYKDS
ncbi:MAG: efflux RND transporter periplasmic adaptor subunit [Saprospiraceae bacterium]|nr:efflux RND transporter periplasmic adaptor subunit [Saprospiraceae bacterium]